MKVLTKHNSNDKIIMTVDIGCNINCISERIYPAIRYAFDGVLLGVFTKKDIDIDEIITIFKNTLYDNLMEISGTLSKKFRDNLDETIFVIDECDDKITDDLCYISLACIKFGLFSEYDNKFGFAIFDEKKEYANIVTNMINKDEVTNCFKQIADKLTSQI